jgi:hypothetical protein
MTPPQPKDTYERTMKMLKPALERVATDPAFRNRLELTPLAALAEMNVELDADTRRELEGKRFSEFWASRRQAAEGPVGVRDLPPTPGQMTDKELDAVSGGIALDPNQVALTPSRLSVGSFAPPYVPVAPIRRRDT